MKKIGVVVQRYGNEVIGGSETYARLISEHLAKHFNIEVITTCAIKNTTWRNEYRPGLEMLNGVSVRRFPTVVEKVNSDGNLTNIVKELEFEKLQGPNSPLLLEYIKDNQNNYDIFVFVTYLYFTTLFGLLSIPGKSILVPTAHDEREIYFDVFKSLFRLPRGIVYLTPEERRFVQKIFNNNSVPNEIMGLGMDLLPGYPERFRRMYKINEPFMVYVGRIEECKGCLDLANFFIRYKRENNSKLKLVFVGEYSVYLPRHKDIINLGILSEGDKKDAIAAADFLIQPSQYESFSVVLMESWSQKRPVLVNGNSEVLRGHAERSNGGLYYTSYPEFAECTNLLLSNAALSKKLGENGYKYVKNDYSWDKIEIQYVNFIKRIIGNEN